MIYKGREYEEVTDGSSAFGDLINVYSLADTRGSVDVWCIAIDDHEAPAVNVKLPDRRCCVSPYTGLFTRYRLIKRGQQTLTFKDKEYRRVPREEVRNGDLLHIRYLEYTQSYCDSYRFARDIPDSSIVPVDRMLKDGTGYLGSTNDVYEVYRLKEGAHQTKTSGEEAQ